MNIDLYIVLDAFAFSQKYTIKLREKNLKCLVGLNLKSNVSENRLVLQRITKACCSLSLSFTVQL